MINLKLIINGENKQVQIEPGEMLADVLRKRLHLTGTKISCDELECGVCTVLVDKMPVLSCQHWSHPG